MCRKMAAYKGDITVRVWMSGKLRSMDSAPFHDDLAAGQGQ